MQTANFGLVIQYFFGQCDPFCYFFSYLLIQCRVWIFCLLNHLITNHGSSPTFCALKLNCWIMKFWDTWTVNDCGRWRMIVDRNVFDRVVDVRNDFGLRQRRSRRQQERYVDLRGNQTQCHTGKSNRKYFFFSKKIKTFCCLVTKLKKEQVQF